MPREHHLSELLLRESHAFEQLVIESLGAWVEHLACGCYGVLAHFLACEHPAQRVWYEQYLVCSLQCGVVVAAHGEQLEQRVEVHELYAGDVVNFLFWHAIAEVFLHLANGVRVAIGDRVAQYFAVFVDAHKVYAPSVDADALDWDISLSHKFQAVYNLVVKGENIPIEMSASLNEVIVETCEFFERYLSILDSAYNSSVACSSKVDSKEVWLCHLFRGYLVLLFSLCVSKVSL